MNPVFNKTIGVFDPTFGTTFLSLPESASTLVLYQAASLAPYGKQMIHAFTGKPLTFGGPGFSKEELAHNRQSLCNRLGLPYDKLVIPNQTHSNHVKSHTDESFADTDAILLSEPGIPVMLQFADCTPVMLFAPTRNVGAVIHAGWRGTAQSIAAVTAQRLMDDFGVAPTEILAVIGPAIGGCCYEVSLDVLEALRPTVSETYHTYTRIPHPSADNADPEHIDKVYVDVQTVNRLQLSALGIQSIETLPMCTQCKADELWSYRRGESGRQSALMMLLP